jgi:hypothetical protein
MTEHGGKQRIAHPHGMAFLDSTRHGDDVILDGGGDLRFFGLRDRRDTIRQVPHLTFDFVTVIGQKMDQLVIVLES